MQLKYTVARRGADRPLLDVPDVVARRAVVARLRLRVRYDAVGRSVGVGSRRRSCEHWDSVPEPFHPSGDADEKPDSLRFHHRIVIM
jgi:hypothetical protein